MKKKTSRTFTPSNILISRTDNIGDLILSIPLADQIKAYYPNCKITFLVRKYTRDVLIAFPNVDEIITYDELMVLRKKKAANLLASKGFDCFFNVQADSYTAKLAKLANIPHRVGTSRRWYHWLYCNHLVHFSRKSSKLHEAQLNLMLGQPVGIPSKKPLDTLIPKVDLGRTVGADGFHHQEISGTCSHAGESQQDKKIDLLGLSKDCFNLVVHPGSNLNGREWPEAYFIELIKQLDPQKFRIYLTGTEKEEKRFFKLIASCPSHVVNIMGRMSLRRFIGFLSQVDGYVSAGTGPLHLAAALEVRCLGLFPVHKNVGPKRWRPLGKRTHYVTQPQACPMKSCDNECCECMKRLSVKQVKHIIDVWQHDMKDARSEPYAKP